MARMIVVRGLRAFADIGMLIMRSAHSGMKKIAEEIKYRLTNITPDWYGPTINIVEMELGRVYVGPSGFVPEEEEVGVKRVKDTCAEFKFRFVDWKTKNKKSRPWLRQMKDEIISSGYGKKIMVEAIADAIEQAWG